MIILLINKTMLSYMKCLNPIIRYMSRNSYQVSQESKLSKLISYGCYDSVNKWFKDGNTLDHNSNAITYAACFNLDKITMLLIDKGLNIETRDQYNRTAIEWATYYSNHSFINSLLFYGANTSGDSWNEYKAPLHYILENTWTVLDDIPELEQHITTANILNDSFNKHSEHIFDIHSQTKDYHLIMLDRIENGLCDKSLLEEMKRFN